MIETIEFTGKSAGCPALWAGRALTDSRSGVKADPVTISTFPGSPALRLPAGRQGRGASHSEGLRLKRNSS